MERVISLCQGEREEGGRCAHWHLKTPAWGRLLAACRGVRGLKKHFLPVSFGPAVQQREGSCLAGGLLPEPHNVTEFRDRTAELKEVLVHAASIY